jgi:hypothetical protein
MQAYALRFLRRGLATATHPTSIHPTPVTSHATAAAASAIPLSNVEAQWSSLSPTEQTVVHQQLEELQRRDWKTLSLSEKKAGTVDTRFVFVFFSILIWPFFIKLIMSPLVRMDLARQSVHPVRPSKFLLAFLSSSVPLDCFTGASALSVWDPVIRI